MLAVVRRLRLEVADRVHGVAVDADLEVEVTAGRLAGGADVPDHLALLDVLTDRDRERRLMAVEGAESTAVVDHRGVAVAAVVPRREDDPGAGRVDRRAARRAEVDAGVERGLAGH